jgi:hypothetical protein
MAALFTSGNSQGLFQNNNKGNVRFTAKAINPAAILCLKIIVWVLEREGLGFKIIIKPTLGFQQRSLTPPPSYVYM